MAMQRFDFRKRSADGNITVIQECHMIANALHIG